MPENKPSQIAELLIGKLLTVEPEWFEQGSCTKVNADPFTPEGARVVQALCETCPVFEQCEEYRRDKNIANGVWGGVDLSEQIVERVR